MPGIFKIAILFLTVLISFINSGLWEVYSIRISRTLYEDSQPGSQHFSVTGYLLYTDLADGSRNKSGPDKFDKHLQKTKCWLNYSRNEVIFKYLRSNYKVLLQNPAFRVRIISPPDICFPFNYFW